MSWQFASQPILMDGEVVQKAVDEQICEDQADAFVEFLNGSYLFKRIFKDDPEAETLRSVTEVADLLQTFEQQMVKLCEQLLEIGLAEHKRREAEVNSFLSGGTKVVTDYKKEALHKLEEFEQQHHQRMVELQQLSDSDKLQVKISHCVDSINKFYNSLMSLELKLSSQLDDLIKELDINISDMVGSFTKTAKGIFAQCQDLEDNYHQDVQDIASATLEKVASGSVGEDMSRDVRCLFRDKNMVMDALSTGHDNHLQKIYDRETEMVERINAWKVSLIKWIEDKEFKRNRTSILDILKYKEHWLEMLGEFQ